jgi:zinc transporter ZupT
MTIVMRVPIVTVLLIAMHDHIEGLGVLYWRSYHDDHSDDVIVMRIVTVLLIAMHDHIEGLLELVP